MGQLRFCTIALLVLAFAAAASLHAQKYSVLYNFGSKSVDPLTPYYGPLVQGFDGNLYGTGGGGGVYNDGTVFEITPGGKLTTLHSFASSSPTDGSGPEAALMQATNGTLYGETTGGGSGSSCGCCGCGTVFSLSVGLGPFVEAVPYSGKVGAVIKFLGQGLTGTTAVLFHGTTTSASFTVKSDTYLIATVPSGATTGFVTVKTPGGTVTSNKVFRVTPVILSFNPTSGTVGTPVTITGASFTGTTKVTFGGVKATVFTVDKDTQITATVPTSAKTGKIQVTTPGGTATSPGVFTVTP
jgi:uncharacterized repeat protein (TIGR03803 family)